MKRTRPGKKNILQRSGRKPIHTPKYQFENIHDLPPGVTLKEGQEGFQVSASTRNVFNALLFFPFLAIAAAQLYKGPGPEADGKGIFFTLVGSLFLGLSAFIAYFLFGKVTLKVQGEKIGVGKSVFGLHFLRWFSIAEVERVRIISRKGMRGIGFAVRGSVRDRIMEIELKDRVVNMGADLQEKDLYFMQFALVQFLKTEREAIRTSRRIALETEQEGPILLDPEIQQDAID